MPMHVEMVTLVRNCKNHKVILSCKFLISMCCRPITHMLWANTWKYRTRQGTSWCHPNCVCLADKSWHLFWSMQSRSLWWSSSGHLVQRGRFRQPKQKQVILSSNPRLTSLMTVYKIPKLTWLLSCLAPIFWCRQGVHQFFFPHNLHSKRSQTFGWPFYIISSAICSISSWVCLKIEDPPNFSRNDPFLDFETSDVIIFDAKSYPLCRFMSLTLMAKTAGTMGTAVTAAYQVWDSCSFFSQNRKGRKNETVDGEYTCQFRTSLHSAIETTVCNISMTHTRFWRTSSCSLAFLATHYLKLRRPCYPAC